MSVIIWCVTNHRMFKVAFKSTTKTINNPLFNSIENSFQCGLSDYEMNYKGAWGVSLANGRKSREMIFCDSLKKPMIGNDDNLTWNDKQLCSKFHSLLVTQNGMIIITHYRKHQTELQMSKNLLQKHKFVFHRKRQTTQRTHTLTHAHTLTHNSHTLTCTI